MLVAAGKARLLCSQKLKQFEGKCVYLFVCARELFYFGSIEIGKAWERIEVEDFFCKEAKIRKRVPKYCLYCVL